MPGARGSTGAGGPRGPPGDAGRAGEPGPAGLRVSVLLSLITSRNILSLCEFTKSLTHINELVQLSSVL